MIGCGARMLAMHVDIRARTCCLHVDLYRAIKAPTYCFCGRAALLLRLWVEALRTALLRTYSAHTLHRVRFARSGKCVNG